jgi:hypothetical protein
MFKKVKKESYRDHFYSILKEVEHTYYNPEETDSLCEFIQGYNAERDFNKICFLWNGSSGSEFKDYNYGFREKISIYICLHEKLIVPSILLKDIIQEYGKASSASWGAPEYLFLLCERLLKESGLMYIRTFGETLFTNMDTYGSCLSIEFTNINVQQILYELKKINPQDKLISDLTEYFISHL